MKAEQLEGLSNQPQEWRHQHRQGIPLPGDGVPYVITVRNCQKP